MQVKLPDVASLLQRLRGMNYNRLGILLLFTEDSGTASILACHFFPQTSQALL